MTRSDIVNQIAKEMKYSKKDIDKVAKLLLETISENIANKETIYIRGFGTFGSKIRKERIGRNLHKNTEIIIPERRVAYFKPGKEIRSIKKLSRIKKTYSKNLVA